MEASDVVILTPHCRHQLRSGPGAPVHPIWELASIDELRRRTGLHIEGGGARTSLICGAIVHEHTPPPWVAALPPLLQLQSRSDGCLGDAVRLLAGAVADHGPGANALIDRSVGILFARAACVHLRQQSAQHAISRPLAVDSDIARALEVIQDRLDAPWTVESMAQLAAMSRSAFAEHFLSAVGDTPIQYLTRTRMQLAANLLDGTTMAIKQVAARVGYRSEAAFSHAFKRCRGSAPGAYRTRHELQAAGAAFR